MIGLYIENVEGVWFGIACYGKKVFAVTFASDEKRVLESLLKSLPFNVPFQHSEKTSVFAKRVTALMKNIYDGKGDSDNFSLVTEHLSDYTRSVIETVSLIPTGYVASYGSVARAAGGSPRAVGRVMASNPFPLVVPCHRVVCSDFTLGGYGGGYNNVPVKLKILKRESRGYTSKRQIFVDSKKLLLFPVECVLNRLRKDKKEIAN
jgi:methylated-DNA-[protein]-cysteine S-methyltransferase